MKQKCFICENKYYYYNVAGEWCLCPRCDVIRLAEQFKKVEK